MNLSNDDEDNDKNYDLLSVFSLPDSVYVPCIYSLNNAAKWVLLLSPFYKQGNQGRLSNWYKDIELLNGRANIKTQVSSSRTHAPNVYVLLLLGHTDNGSLAQPTTSNSTLFHSGFYSEQHSRYPSTGKNETLGTRSSLQVSQEKKNRISFNLTPLKKKNLHLKPYLCSWKSQTPTIVSTD